MNSLERIFASIRGAPVDRRPFTLILSLYGARLTDCPLEDYFSRPEKYLAGQRAVVDLCDPDILFTPFALTLEAQAFGCELAHFDKGPPNVRKPACRGLSDLSTLRSPDPASDPGLAFLVESTRLLAKEFGTEKPIAAVLTAPVDLPALLVTMGEWIEALLFHPQIRDDLAGRTAAHFLALGNAMIEAGATFVATPAVFTNPRIITKDMARECVIPLLAETFAHIKAPVLFHHGGSPLSGFLDVFQGMPNVAGFALDQRDSFAEARGVLGPDPVLLGNLSGPHLPGYSPQEAYERTRGILSDRKDDPRYIFCTANADVPWHTPPETIRAVRQAVLDSAKGIA